MDRINWFAVVAVLAAFAGVAVGIWLGNAERATVQGLVGFSITFAVLSIAVRDEP